MAGRVVRLAADLAHRVPVLHDISDGGTAVAATEIAIASNVGVTIDSRFPFCEDPHRFLVAMNPGEFDLPDTARRIGTFGGDEIRFGPSTVPLAEARTIFQGAIPRRMA
jgi:phosphoribosylformylglycinamidine synthase